MDKFHEELMEIFGPKGHHKRFWLWYADNLDKSRSDWPEFVCSGGGIPYVHCFACTWSNMARRFMGSEPDCAVYCPIDWDGKGTQPGIGGCYCTGSPYNAFTKPLAEKTERPALARQIANLPLLPELIEESNELPQSSPAPATTTR